MVRRYVCIAAVLAVSFLTVPCAHANPYIARVWEYCPAPGQFVNELPEYENGDDANDICIKVEEYLADRIEVTLGGWGGYIVFGFDHMVVNQAGANDFVVYGNAFYNQNGYTLNGRKGGSCEPGIVMVSYDTNGNGKPDDAWYELAGSEYTNPQTIHDYAITYTRPANEKDNIPWQDNKGHSGFIYRTSAVNKRSYYPKWIESSTMQFSGSRLPDNYVDESESGDGSYYVLYSYPYGYADNHPNTSAEAQLDISWAVRADGTPANLPGIHFVKVYNGMNQQCGSIGETSTEITGAEDLHPDAVTGVESIQPSAISIHKIFRNGQICLMYKGTMYNVQGQVIGKR